MAKDCTSTALYESLKYCPGEPSTPGIRQAVYYVPKRAITTYPTLAASAESATGIAPLVEYNGNFVLAADEKFLRLDLIPEKGMVDSEPQGEDYFRTYLNKITLTHPKNDVAATAFARQALNDDLLYVVQQRDGKWRILGNEMFSTKTSPKLSTGEGATSAKGLTIEIEVTDVCPAPFYVGTLDTVDGEIDCSGNAVTDTADNT